MMAKYFLSLCTGVAASIAASAAFAQAPAFAPPQIAYVEEMVTTYKPTEQRVIVPVREYRSQTRLHGWWNPFREPHLATHQIPVTRWEERLQTTYAPVTQRRYRPVYETSGRVMPPLQLATRPQSMTQAAASRRLYDDLPVVAMQPPPGSQTPRTTLVPQTYKPAPRSSTNELRPFTPR